MAGRAAMITRSEFCQPLVMRSISGYPEARPDTPPVRLEAACICIMAWLRTGSICVTSRFSCVCEISNRAPSASWSRSSTSLASSKAFPSMVEAKVIRRRARYFCATMRAWNSTLAADITRVVSSAMYTGPPTSCSVPSRRSSSVTVIMSMGCCVSASWAMAW